MDTNSPGRTERDTPFRAWVGAPSLESAWVKDLVMLTASSNGTMGNGTVGSGAARAASAQVAAVFMAAVSYRVTRASLGSMAAAFQAGTRDASEVKSARITAVAARCRGSKGRVAPSAMSSACRMRKLTAKPAR